MNRLICLIVVLLGLITQPLIAQEETLAKVKGGKGPQNFEQMWDGFDPSAEPLDTEILQEWEEEGVVLQVLRYRIGVFKGQKAFMAAVYGYPKGGKELPGLVQIHGGGQYADHRAVLTNAKRGYATISIAWAGRIKAPNYTVNPSIVKLFWDGKTEDLQYRVTTDWGPLDGYHAPCRNPKNNFNSVAPQSWTFDEVDSPRNNPWFLSALGARRALTFLEMQPQVDPEKLGVYGHSMGGKLTVMTTAADDRVKASAPSCGGISDRNNGNALFGRTIADDVNLRDVSCPIIFLSPSNDFHGKINDLQKALQEIDTDQWRVTCSPHHNHQDTKAYQVAGLLWFDQYLKGRFVFPQTPKSTLKLNARSGVPSFSVTPDASKPILSVDIFYTQQGQKEGEKDNKNNTKNRFWHHANAVKTGSIWTADLPLFSIDKPLWVYANVVYPTDEPVTGAGYYYAVYTANEVNLSSRMHSAAADELKAAGVKATVESSLLIESFEGDWEKEWFSYSLHTWPRKTHKLYSDKWKAPSSSAKLAFEVLADSPNKMIVGVDKSVAEIQLNGDSKWQQVVLTAADFHDAGGVARSDWKGIKEFRLGDQETLRGKVDGKDKVLRLGAGWKGANPKFRNLRWVEDSEKVKAEANRSPLTPESYPGKTFTMKTCDNSNENSSSRRQS